MPRMALIYVFLACKASNFFNTSATATNCETGGDHHCRTIAATAQSLRLDERQHWKMDCRWRYTQVIPNFSLAFLQIPLLRNWARNLANIGSCSVLRIICHYEFFKRIRVCHLLHPKQSAESC